MASLWNIWWIRRDVRLFDNHALTAAADLDAGVLPVFILDPALLRSRYNSEKRLAFLLGGLRALDADLRQRGSHLIVRQGDPVSVLEVLRAETGASAVFAEADYSPYACQRDIRLAEKVPLHLKAGLTVQPPGRVVKPDGAPYTVFTPFKQAWKRLPLPARTDLWPVPQSLQKPPLPGNLNEMISWRFPGLMERFSRPRINPDLIFIPGSAEAQTRLARFAGEWGEFRRSLPIDQYDQGRNFLPVHATSELSPYLRFGMLSARQVVLQALEAIRSAPDNAASQGAQTWLDELIWREFYIHILYHFPSVRRRSYRPEFDRIPWVNSTSHFVAWQQGSTGYPVVDAAMRALSETGWMHNRARMIVASFLTKHLLIDWRWGEAWFMQHLLDGDPAANNGGWQWAAGTGADAAPYFRIFNPIIQGKKFDPQGIYIRRWVSELERVPQEYIHEPWSMPLSVQIASGCQIGGDYPAPIVDHAWARARALAVFSALRHNS